MPIPPGVSVVRRTTDLARSTAFCTALGLELSAASTPAMSTFKIPTTPSSCRTCGQPVRPGRVLTDVVPTRPRWEEGHLLPLDGTGLGIESTTTPPTTRVG